MSTTHFYKQLPIVKDFSSLSDDSVYHAVPSDWVLFATDVQNSTIHIENGLYKQINMVGAMSIVSILNINRGIDLPFIFGGDGAFILTPSFLFEEASTALLAVHQLAEQTYGLQLRVGCIKVNELYKANKALDIAKYQVSNEYEQVLVKGEGLDYFDVLLKKDDTYHLKALDNKTYEANLEGLECRWQQIETPKDKTFSLMLKCQEQKDYKLVLQHLENIIGTLDERHPIQTQRLLLSFNDKDLNMEAALKSQKGLSRFCMLLKLKMINALGWILMYFHIGLWGKYKQRIVSTTDVQKFDDMLRMVFSASKEQQTQLRDYLQKAYSNNELVFGLHESKSALMTCLIFERHGKHIHFVDSSDGGYAMAAKEFKQKMKSYHSK